MKLSEIVEFNPSTPLRRGTVAPFVDMASLPTTERYFRITETREFKGSGSKFRDGDTLLARITPCLENGKGGFVRGLGRGVAAHGSTEFIVLRPKKTSDADFVYYVTRHPDFRSFAIKQMSGTSGRQRVAWQALTDYELVDLTPFERAALGSLLSALDDKIELNRRMNATLETMARAIFRDWFVDFGPTRAKMQGRPPYLAPEIWSLFPDRLDDEGKPEGWAIRRVADFATIRGGKQLQKEKIADTGPVPVFGGAGLMGYTTEHNAEGFVISVGRVGAYCGQFFSHRGKAWINNNASLIRPHPDVSGEWLFLALRHIDIDAIKKGAAQPFVANGDIAKAGLIWPGNEAINLFSEIVVPLILKAEANERESRTLAQTRDLLLPRLMSGALRVAEAERLVEEAL